MADTFSYEFDNTGNVSFPGNLSLVGSIYFTSSTGGIVNADTITVLDFIRSDNYQFSNGVSILSTVYGNANVASYLLTYTGNISSGNINVTGNIVDTGALSIITGSNGNIALIPNGTGIVTVSTAMTVAGNITGNYFIGNGSQLTGIASGYGNANVTTLLANFGSNTISTTGNITGGNILSSTFQAVNSGGGTLKNASGATQASWGAGGGDNFAVSVSTNLNGANAQIDISPTGSGHVHIKPTGTGAVEIAPTNVGSINNMVIGNVTPAAVSATTVSASGNITGGNITTTGIVYGNAAPGATGTISNAVGYLGIPQNSQSTNYTLALTDQGRHIYLTANSNITIPANSSISFPIGSAISVVNGPNVRSNVLITSDTLYLAANGATGTRSISTYGMFTLVKVTNTIWYINGSGIT